MELQVRAAAPAPQAAAPHRHEHHRDVQGGAARAAVFGVSDGLLTNVSLILGVAAAHPAVGVVRLAGFAGLVAGAFSMATGEYVSMSAQRELIEREVAIEREELRRHPEQEHRELVALYVSRGVPRAAAEEVSTALARDPELALEVHTREELGVNPASTGSPPAAAASSFGSFALGAVVPLLPWFFSSGNAAVVTSIILGALMAIGVGIAVASFTGRSRFHAAARQLAIAALAAAVTYGVGTLVGVHTS
ncbi:MAG: VIT1/CCC1 transporter family protein [Candidatus Dormibacteraeota bacterium]|uniref:VIT1/CCC1 transporter family protein n=1 Tax=Candidatus Amunia macphersoniae TaxID=3127014 RepID=A0A934KGE5_9BACT|nr:VIT1/CCC1 transporter family protein [Candidatus Dormibacteraeota bacterium]